MKRTAKTLALALCACVFLQTAPQARALEENTWSRVSPDGNYVTLRIECSETANLENPLAVYADTGEPIPFSDYYDGGVYATVPVTEQGRPLTCETRESVKFTDMQQTWKDTVFNQTPLEAKDLSARGILKGDQFGALDPYTTLTRAEAFTMLVRMMGIRSTANPGYRDVAADDWYYAAACAAKAYGIAAAGELFEPDRLVTRQELAVMVYRIFDGLGWAGSAQTLEELALEDGASIPDWALDAYLHGFGAFTVEETETGKFDEYDGAPIMDVKRFAEPSAAAMREELVCLLYSALRFNPVYPSKTAIEYGFDAAMPEIDGSTSTYGYTNMVYSSLFHNYTNHPQFPDAHSKSYESYERLINGEADLLFAATAPSEEQKAAAKAAGVELEYIPIAYDAMVFFTNAENSIAGLTKEQIRDIYVDNAYGNWNQVGGPDAELLPYCRNTASGSHALMEHWFLEGGKLTLSPAVTQVNTSMAMTSALTDVAQALRTDPPAYAMGYSVYYYYTRGYWLLGDAGGGELKLLAVDGVVPSDATIADGSYPLSDYNYLVFRSGEPSGSAVRRMADYMLTPAGQECVERAGYGPLTPAE